MNGTSAEKHLGRTLRDVVGDAVAEQVEPAIRSVLASAQPVHVDVRAGLPIQQPRAVVVSLFPLLK